MKRLKDAAVLVILAGFSLLGCDEKVNSPVGPARQQTPEPVSLGKSNDVTSSFSLNSLKELTGEGKMWYAGGKLQMKEFGVWEMLQTTETRVAGRMKHYLSLTVDVVTGEGPCHGSFTIYPDAAGGGVWEGTYEGYRSATNDPNVFTLPLKAVGHGSGGTIDNMQLFLTITLIVRTSPTNPPAPPQVPIYWAGDGVGTVQGH
jgi:hypothetical protein